MRECKSAEVAALFNPSSLALYDASGIRRLRLPQHGALHALAAHFTNRDEPGIVALPTGLGKTLVMQTIPHLSGARRLLVVASNRLLREQIADDFRRNKNLLELGLLSANAPPPRTFAVQEQMRSEEAWTTLQSYDVVVALPQCLSTEIDGIVPPPCGLFDMVLIDEAHHMPARTWTALIHEFAGARIAMFTATPFRRDRRSVPGSLVYDYPMKRAIAEGLIAPLQLETVAHDTVGDVDVALVQRVKDLVQQPGEYQGVPFLARTSSIKHAHELVKLYAEHGIGVGLVLGEHSLRYAKGVLRAFRERRIEGLIMVGALGEGFDFPDVKIAAYHRRHKSLPVTLQFFGRITRVNASHNARPLVLIAEQEVADDTAQLYRRNADWATLIPQLADDTIASERSERAFRAEFAESVNGAVADETLLIRKLVDVFELDHANVIELDTNRLEAEERSSIIQTFGGAPNDFVSFIRFVENAPRWSTTDVLTERNFELETIVHHRDGNLLLVNSKSAARSAALAKAFGVSEPRRLPPERINAVLAEHDVSKYINLGIRSVDAPSDLRPAYKSSSGSSVGTSLTQIERDSYALGHAYGQYEEDGLRRYLGASHAKGRFWKPEYAVGLSAYLAWCDEFGALIDRAAPRLTAPLLDLRPTSRVERFDGHPALAFIGNRMLERGYYFRGAGAERYYCFELDAVPTIVENGDACKVDLYFDGNLIASVRYDVDGTVTVQSAMRLYHSIDALEAEAEFADDPIAVYYADGSSSYGVIASRPSELVPIFSNMQSYDWNGTNIRRERTVDGQRGIFDHLHDQLHRQYPEAIIINDDGQGEIADVIVIIQTRSGPFVKFYHCKGATGAGADLNDLYVVIGQAQRSTRWTKAHTFWPEARRRLDTRFRLIAGNMDDVRNQLQQWADVPPVTSFAVHIVQPGIVAERVIPGENVARFLSLCQSLVEAHAVSFGLICSSTANHENPAEASVN